MILFSGKVLFHFGRKPWKGKNELHVPAAGVMGSRRGKGQSTAISHLSRGEGAGSTQSSQPQ